MSIFYKLFKNHKPDIEHVANFVRVEGSDIAQLTNLDGKPVSVATTWENPTAKSILKPGKESSEFKVTIAFNLATILGTLLGHVSPETTMKSLTLLNAIYSIGRVVLKLFKK